MELRAHPRRGDRDRHRPAGARRAPGRPRALLAAQRRRCAPGLPGLELSGRRLRAHQHGLQRPAAGACGGALRRPPYGRPRGACAKARHCRPRQPGDPVGRRRPAARHQGPRRAGRGRASPGGRLARPAGAPDRALGHAIDHLHLRHHGAVEGCPQLVLPRLLELRPRHLAVHHVGGPLPHQPAALSPGRRDHRLRHALPARLDHAGGVLRDTDVLGDRAPHRGHLGVPARRHGAVPGEGAAPTRRPRPHPAHGRHGAAGERCRRVHGALRPGGLFDLQHDRALLPGDDHRAHDRAGQCRPGAARLRASRGRWQRLRGGDGRGRRDRGAGGHALGDQPRLLQGAGGDGAGLA